MKVIALKLIVYDGLSLKFPGKSLDEQTALGDKMTSTATKGLDYYLP